MLTILQKCLLIYVIFHPVQYDPDKLIDYPGFNVPPPPNVIEVSLIFIIANFYYLDILIFIFYKFYMVTSLFLFKNIVKSIWENFCFDNFYFWLLRHVYLSKYIQLTWDKIDCSSLFNKALKCEADTCHLC